MILRRRDHFHRCPRVLTAIYKKMRDVFRVLSDGGQIDNWCSEMEDAVLSAFSVFFSQSPSFLDSQVRMQKQQGKNTASTLFGVHEIPHWPASMRTLLPSRHTFFKGLRALLQYLLVGDNYPGRSTTTIVAGTT